MAVHQTKYVIISGMSGDATIWLIKISAIVWAKFYQMPCHIFCCYPPFENVLLRLHVLAWLWRDQFEAAHPLAKTMVVELDEAAL
jgi:hypothetical protein